jgi:hypothetical protein
MLHLAEKSIPRFRIGPGSCDRWETSRLISGRVGVDKHVRGNRQGHFIEGIDTLPTTLLSGRYKARCPARSRSKLDSRIRTLSLLHASPSHIHPPICPPHTSLD